MTQPIIQAQNIHKTFRNGEIQVHALREVNPTIAPGAPLGAGRPCCPARASACWSRMCSGRSSPLW